MKKQIWKFPLDQSNQIVMPEGAQVLSVQTQNETPCLWALVNPENKRVTRIFNMIATGDPITEDLEKYRYDYYGTVQLKGGLLVYHVFEFVEQPIPTNPAPH